MKQIERLREKQATEMAEAVKARDEAQRLFTECARRVNELESRHQAERFKAETEIAAKGIKAKR